MKTEKVSATQLKKGDIILYKDNSCEDYYFVVNLYDNEIMFCKCDFMLRGSEPSLTDFWRMRYQWFNEQVENGNITIQNQ